MKKIRDMKLFWKLNLVNLLVFAVVTTAIYFSLLPYYENDKTNERKGKLKAAVNVAVSMMDHYERSLRQGLWIQNREKELSGIESAKKAVLKNIREMRYDKTEYFFILDIHGNMVLDPFKPELEGTNMRDVTDAHGNRIFENLVYNAQRDGEAFETNVWQSKYSSIRWESQITYAKYYWPWNLIVCSSLYTQDITEAMDDLQKRILIYSVLITVLMTLIWALVIGVSITKPLNRLLSGINAIDQGDLSFRIANDSGNEIGYITDEFNKMTSNLEESRRLQSLSEQKFRELADLLPDIVFEGDIFFRIK
ncbi:MAG: cache domain-containing protein, partial [Spirochaetota bacterium]